MHLANSGIGPASRVYACVCMTSGLGLTSVSGCGLSIYDLKTGKSQKINLGDYTDFYIPRIKWTNDSNILSVQVLNRHQNNLDLHFVDMQFFLQTHAEMEF